MLRYDKNKYGRALPDFWTYLVNLSPEKHEFMCENFALSLTGNPYSGVALDLWIEVIMNKGSKVKAPEEAEAPVSVKAPARSRRHTQWLAQYMRDN